MPTETIYVLVFRDRYGEKIAEKVTVRVPGIGEIIAINYLDAQGDFEVVREIRRAPKTEYEIVSLEVKPVDHNHHGSSLSWENKINLLFFINCVIQHLGSDQ